MKIIHLPIMSDLSETSLEEAEDLLGGKKSGLLITGSKLQLNEGFKDWLWNHRRGHSFMEIPGCILKNDFCWTVSDAETCVVSGGIEVSSPKTGAINAYATSEEVYQAWMNMKDNHKLYVYEIRIDMMADLACKRAPVAWVILGKLP